MTRRVAAFLAWCMVGISAYWMFSRLELGELAGGARLLAGNGPLLAAMWVGYAAAFWLRSIAWACLLPKRPLTVGRLWLYHQIGLLLNHLLPVKGGELARAALLKQQDGFTWPEALISVGATRLLDMAALLAVGGMGMLLLPGAWSVAGVEAPSAVLLLAALLPAAVLGGLLMFRLPWERWWPRLRPYVALLRAGRWGWAFVLTLAGWLAEAVVIWAVVHALGEELEAGQAILIHALTIVGQVFHVTPGGIGTYEVVMSALLMQVAGFPLAFALQAALLSHAFKFLFSFVCGGFAAWRLWLSPIALFRRTVNEQGEESV